MLAGFVGAPEALLALFIPILAIVMGCGIGLLAVYLDYAKRKRFMELQHQQRMAAIEKGIDLPPMTMECLGLEHRPRRRPSYLLKGLVWLFVGSGIVGVMFANFRERQALYGLIPAGIGLAYLIYYFVEGKKLEAASRQAEAEQANTGSANLPPRLGNP